MNYFTEADTLDKKSLDKALSQQIEPFVVDANEEYKRLEGEFIEKTKDEQSIYDAAAFDELCKAEQEYKPIEAAYKVECKKIIDRAMKQVDKHTEKLNKVKIRVQRAYDEATKPQREAFDEATKPAKAELDIAKDLISSKLQDLVAPINAEYEALADQFNMKMH